MYVFLIINFFISLLFLRLNNLNIYHIHLLGDHNRSYLLNFKLLSISFRIFFQTRTFIWFSYA